MTCISPAVTGRGVPFGTGHGTSCERDVVGSTLAAANQGDCDDHRNEQRSRHRHQARVQPVATGPTPRRRSNDRVVGRPSVAQPVLRHLARRPGRPPRRRAAPRPLPTASRTGAAGGDEPAVPRPPRRHPRPDLALRGHRRNVHHRFGTRRRAQPHARSSHPDAPLTRRLDRTLDTSSDGRRLRRLRGVGRRRRILLRRANGHRERAARPRRRRRRRQRRTANGPQPRPPARPNVRRLPQPRRQPAAHRVDRRTPADRDPSPLQPAVDLDLDDGTYRYTIDGPDKRITGTLTVS